MSTSVALRASATTFSTFRIMVSNPPAIANSRGVDRGNGRCGSPFVTSTDGIDNMVAWLVGTKSSGSDGDQRLLGYDGDTSAVVYDGGGPKELMAGTHSYSTTGIVARGHVHVAGDNKVYVFDVPTPTPPPRPTPTPRPRPTPR
jgi:hypothetical protein